MRLFGFALLLHTLSRDVQSFTALIARARPTRPQTNGRTPLISQELPRHPNRYFMSLAGANIDDKKETETTKVLASFTNEKKGGSPEAVWKARAILISVSAFYGTNFACVKILNDAMDPSLAAFIRFAIAASVFSPNLLRIIKTNPSLVKGGLEVGAYSSLGYWAQSNALESTSASIVAFICSLAVIVVPLLDRFVDKKKGEGMWYSDFIAPVLATIGVACLELGGADLPGVGSLWAFAQPLFFGLGFWRIEKIIKQAKEAGEAQGFTGAMMLTVAAFTLVWTLSSFFSPLLHGDAAAATSAVASQLQSLTSWKVICSLLWTGVVTTALTSFGENIAMKELSAAESTVIYSTEPLWGTAFAALTLGEHIGANTIVGAVLVISACVWSSMGPSLAALVLASQETWLASFAEVAENLATNWDELLRRLSGFGG